MAKPCSRHIGIFLLLVFTSSLFGDSVITAQNIYKYSKQSDSGVLATSTCPQKAIHAFEAAGNEAFQFDLSDDHEQEDAAMILSNCSSNLQLLPVDTLSLIAFPSSSLIRNSVQLLSTQLFVNKLADPPRIG